MLFSIVTVEYIDLGPVLNAASGTVTLDIDATATEAKDFGIATLLISRRCLLRVAKEVARIGV